MGCKEMDAVTYPNPTVIKFIRENVIPVRVLWNQEPLASRFDIKWTPTLILVDPHGKEVYRSEGFLSPRNFIPAFMLGIGRMRSNEGHYAEAISSFNELTSKYPQSEEAPQAIYYRGIAQFKMTKDLKAMKKAYEQLAATYPNSSWTRKARPYAALK